jgi:hypothetical protein
VDFIAGQWPDTFVTWGDVLPAHGPALLLFGV